MMPHSLQVENISNKPSSSSSAMQQMSFPSSLEDFLNIDMFTSGTGPSSALVSGGSSSRSSSRSPSDSFAQLPTTPPQQQVSSFDADIGGGFGGMPSIEEDPLFNYRFDDAMDYLKSDPLAALSSTTSFDFLGSFDGSSLPASASTIIPSESAGLPTANATQTPFSGFAIDPQLVETPAPSAASAAGDEEEEGEEEDDMEEEGLVIAPVKVGGKGKARKGTLQSGGVVKRTGAAEKELRALSEDMDSIKDSVPDDWRPSPEEYQKMSSKEKRQLRNKISARNFRVRRKEYIHTLEGDIAERDRLIDAIRNELGSTKSENLALRQEVSALKKAILEGRASPMLPPPAPLSPTPFTTISPLSTSLSANTSTNIGAGSIVKPNTKKDLPTSPRLAAAGSAFWGGQAGGFGTFGGITPVHTTLIPEYGMPSLAGKPTITGGSNMPSSDSRRKANENMNPALNQISSVPLAMAASKVFSNGNGSSQPTPFHRRSSSPVLSTMPAPATSNTVDGDNSESNVDNQNLLMSQLLGQMAGNPSFGFDAFSDVNPFTLKTLDSYRMQLWGRMAAQQQTMRRDPAHSSSFTSMAASSSANTSPTSSPGGSPNPGLYGLASNMRPHFFASTPGSSAPRSSLGALLSGKLPSSSPSTSSAAHAYPTPPSSPKSTPQTSVAEQQHQRQMAQTALLANLASQTLLQKMGQAFWDAFSGHSASTSGAAGAPKGWDSEKVRKVLDGTAVLRVVDVEPVKKPESKVTAASASATAGLEETMRSMSLGSASSVSKDDQPFGFLQRAKTKMNCGRSSGSA